MTRRKPIDDAPQQPTAVPSSPATEAWFAHRPWVLALVLVIVTFAAYQPTWHAGFIWDDDQYFTENPALLSVSGLEQIWSSLSTSRFVPLTLTSFWVERHFWGLHPLPCHVVNVGLHASNAVLLWVLLRRLRVPGAWMAAAVWALHPVNTDTVAWVAELKNTQSALFFLLALLMFLRVEDRWRLRDYAVALVLGAAAMLSKPSTVVLPGVMLLCAWWRRRRWTRNDFLRVAPLVAFGAAMSLLTIVEQRHEIVNEGASEWALTAAQRVMLAGRAPWFYAGKVLWPADLCCVYPRWELAVHSVVAWLPLDGLALVAATLWQFRRARWAQSAIFGLGYFIIALVPVLGFFDVFYFRFSYVADHFQYLACVGLIALAVSAGGAISARAGQWGRDGARLAAAIVLLLLGVSTWRQARVYQNQETLWRDTLAKNPNAWMAHNNLGIALQQTGKFEEAIPHFEQALRIRPDYAKAHNNLGVALGSAGRYEEAIAHYEQALRIKPDSAETHNNLGTALDRTGKREQAMEQYRQALRISPDYAEAHDNLGTALNSAGRYEEAIAHYEQALRIKPDYAKAHYNLGNALAQVGRVPEAIPHYRQALAINPGYAEAHSKLGGVLIVTGKPREAIAHLERALQIQPDLAEAQNNLAWVLATLPPAQGGDPVRAVALAQRACELSGNRAPGYLDTLAVAYAAAGRFDAAVATARKAIELARAAGQPGLVKEIQARLELYRSGRAYHLPVSPATSPPDP